MEHWKTSDVKGPTLLVDSDTMHNGRFSLFFFVLLLLLLFFFVFVVVVVVLEESTKKKKKKKTIHKLDIVLF